MKFHPKFAKKSTQTGYSLIELSIALAIVGVVIAGTVVGVQSILRSNNVNKTIAQTNTAVNKIVGKLVRDPNYKNATTKNLSEVGQEIWSTTDIQSGGSETVQVRHPLAARLFVEPLASTFKSIKIDQGYVYTLSGIPVAACVDLAVGVEGLAYALFIKNEDWPGDRDQGINVLTSAAAGTEIKDPLKAFDSAAANNACIGSADANRKETATISFLVPRR